MPYQILSMTYQKESFRGGPLGKRARFLPMLPMNSPKNDPPLKMGTPRLVGSVHLVCKTSSQPCMHLLHASLPSLQNVAYPRNPKTKTRGSVLIQFAG